VDVAEAAAIEHLLARYEELAVRWDATSGVALTATRLHERLLALAPALRSTDAGRAGLVALTGHRSRGVRLVAGVQCLAFDPDRGRAALRSLVDDPGSHSLAAAAALDEDARTVRLPDGT